MAVDTPLKIGEPVLRWSSRAHSIAEVESELARIWVDRDTAMTIAGESGRRIAARTSVMNLIVIARRPELAEHCAATMQELTGQHPSRTVVIGSADPDGPSWVDARVEAHCVLPRIDAPETCAEMIHVTAGGEAGQHLSAIATPLIVHDLPVTIWWPGEPPFGARPARELFALADRLIVDGSTWSGDGLEPLREMAELLETTDMAISDFALLRQARWREAIASIFDDPDFVPYLRSLRRVAVTYGTHDEAGAPGTANLVKPVYHIGWLASRLDLHVRKPLAEVAGHGPASSGSGRAVRGPNAKPVLGRGLVAMLSDGRADVSVVMRPVVSKMPSGTTLRVELLAERRGSELRADVTAEADTVHVRVWLDGVEALDRHFLSPRMSEVDLLAQSIEASGRDPIESGALRAAAALIAPHEAGTHRVRATGG
jgi:glucose-6-phosphate dehydrogenase assembly protein OpcA